LRKQKGVTFVPRGRVRERSANPKIDADQRLQSAHLCLRRRKFASKVA